MLCGATLVTACVAGCVGRGPRGRPHRNVFTSPGKRLSPDSRHELVVDIDAGGNVTYLIRDAAGGKERVRGRSGSVYHYWAFSWGEDGSLWVWNSDMGGCFWTLVDEDRWEKTPLDSFRRDESFLRMPKELFDRLPNSVRKGYRRK
jgi:hypothetical protein